MREFCLKISCLWFLLGGITACSNSDEPVSGPQPFSLQSSIYGVSAVGQSSLSRAPQLDAAGQGSFSKGDVNTVFMADRNQRFICDFAYTYGHAHYWEDFQLDEADGDLQVSACYPAVKATDPTRFSWDVSSHEQATSDFLAAMPVGVKQGETQPISLHFTHLMHKLVVKLEADGTTVTGSDLAGASITLTHVKPQALINLLTATVQGASGQTIQLQEKGTDVHFILPPQAVETMEVRIDLNGRTQTYKLADLTVGSSPLTHLESGKAFTLKVKVSKTAFTITGQGIGPWGSQGEANGEIIL